MGKAELAWALGTLLQGTPSHHHHMQYKTTRTRKENKTTQSSVTHVLIALIHSHTHTYKYSDTLDRFVCELKTPAHAHGLTDSTNKHTCTNPHAPQA